MRWGRSSPRTVRPHANLRYSCRNLTADRNTADIMGCHTSKESHPRFDSPQSKGRCRAKLKLDISTHSSSSSTSRQSECPSEEDSPYKKLRLLDGHRDCGDNNKASPSPHSDADTVALTPVQATAVGVEVGTRSRSSSTNGGAGDEVEEEKHVPRPRARDPSTAKDSEESEVATEESEDEFRGDRNAHAGDEIVAESLTEENPPPERLEADETAASARLRTSREHERVPSSDLDCNTPAVEQGEGSSQPKSAPSEAPLSQTQPVLAELKIFLDKHRPKKPEMAENTCPPCSLNSGLGLRYKGHLRRPDNLPHGWGHMTLPDGIVYEGQWSGGRVHGNGALQLPNGNAYWGSWALGRKHGLGTFVWADGSRHDGYYRAGRKSGVGTLKYASGAVFEGQFQDDRRHGVGRLELLDGSSYDGEWVKDVPGGLGVFVDAGHGGERFEGSWERGLRSGGGRLVQGWAETREEDGDSGNTGPEGVGSFAGAAWYSGSFKDGLPHGEGAMGYGSASFCGHVERGLWTGGGRVDLGGENGSFEGTFSDGLPSGSGRWRWEGSGVEMDCSFEEGYSRKIWPT